MAILILALLELDVSKKLKILFLWCKENSGTKSFADLLLWLDPPSGVLGRIGRLVGDQERNKSSYSHTKFDINPRERRQMLSKCQLIMATGGTVAQDLTMPWSTLSGFMQDLSLMVIDEGQQYGTDREIATISLLKQQPLVLWTGDAQQTPGGIARTAPNAKRSRQLLLAKKHGLRSDRNYYMPSNLAEAMIRLLDDSSNEGLHLLNQTLRNSEHVLGRVWTEQLSPADEEDLRAVNKVLPGLDSHFRAALASEQAQLPTKVDPTLLEGTAINFSRSLIRLAWMLQHVETLLPMAGEIQAELNSHTAGVSDIHAWGLMLPSSSRVSPVTYHSVVAVRYPDLCRLMSSRWELGSFASGGIASKPPGYQFILWDTNAKINGLVAADLETLVSQVLSDFPYNTGFADGLFVMTTATDHKNNLNRSTLKKDYARTLRVETIANSAGGTAAVAMVAQPSTGFLNGRFQPDGSPTEDTEDCLGRITVGLTRSKSLTLVVSPLDMMGLIGMAQVLATLAFFFPSMADVALWLGPYMSISSKNIICTRTQKVRKCRQITTNQKPHKPARRPANPPARFAFRQEKQQTKHTKGARAQTKTPTIKICHRTQRSDHCVTLKNMPKMNYPPRHSVKHGNRNIMLVFVGIDVKNCT